MSGEERSWREISSSRDLALVKSYMEQHGLSIDTPVHYQGYTALKQAIYDGEDDWVVSLLELGADPNFKDVAGETPFFAALSMNDVDLIELLVSKADLSIQVYDKSYLSWVLSWYFACSAEQIANSLMDHYKFDPNEENRYGRTLLHLAAHHNFLSIVNRLIKSGADVNRNLETFLSLDVHACSLDTIRLLQTNGLKVYNLNFDSTSVTSIDNEKEEYKLKEEMKRYGFKIIEKSVWFAQYPRLKGTESEQFMGRIHLSPEHKIGETLQRKFNDKQDLLLVCVQLENVITTKENPARVEWKGVYPHVVNGYIDCSTAVVWHHELLQVSGSSTEFIHFPIPYLAAPVGRGKED